MKIVITTHGDLCLGIVNSFKMIAGDNDDVIPVKLTEAGIGEFTQNLYSTLDELTSSDSVLILCDLKGGTPYNQSYSYHLKYPNKTRVVYGVNLPMLIETSFMMNGVQNIDELVAVALNAGNAGIGSVSIDEMDEEDDLDF